MKRFNSDIKDDPSFNTVNGLSNKTFDPENIVSGRGATEDQLKVVGDVVKDLDDYITEFGCSDCDQKYQSIRQELDDLQAAQEECCQNRVTQENLDALIRELTNRLDDLQTAQEECCQNRVTQENLDAIVQNLQSILDDLQAQIDECCSKQCFDGGGASTDCDGSTVTVTMSWDSNPIANGGQMTASSSGGANIVFYYFLIKSAAGVYVPVGTIGFAGQGYSVNGSTGKLSFDPGGGHGSVSGIAIGARDANGCEGIGMFVPVTGVNP